MCGITGSMARNGGTAIAGDVLAKMISALTHRGPDDRGEYTRNGVSLGFRRLSIIDIDGGHQPMYSEDGGIVLVCNGEIFDHERLREELRRNGHRFRTGSDVEVIVHLYEEEGIDLVHRLNGQFAFALYDRALDRLYLARDQLGIIPLFYADTGEHLVFGSEIKSLLPHPGVGREVDLVGLDQVLTFPGLVSPRTLFRGVSSLRPGHYLRVDDGGVREVKYWDLDYPTEPAESAGPAGPGAAEEDDRYYVERLRDLLATAVDRRLVADVPVGFYLSGGLDSSLIAALAAERAPGSHSYSVTFGDAGIDESRYQRLMAEEAGSRHHAIECSTEDIAATVERMVWHAECPVKESYNTCSLLLSQLARDTGTPVILTGEGADELFGGYVGYRFDQVGGHRGGMGGDLAGVLERELRTRLWGEPELFYERDYHAWRDTKLDLYAHGVRERFADVDCLREQIVEHAMLRGRGRLNQRSYLDSKLRLSDHLLADHGDRMTMASSVEARYPFLDRDVVEFARTIPPRLKVGRLGEKHLLKRAAAGLVPTEIIGREKFGFRAPGSPSLLRRYPEWTADLLSPARIKRQGVFDPGVVEHLTMRHRDADDVHPHFDDDLLLVVLTFSLLHDAFDMTDTA